MGCFFSCGNTKWSFFCGSQMSNKIPIGNKGVQKTTNSIGGFMHFESEDKNIIVELLKKYAVIM
ncbi:MAG: hypothetical protein ACI9D5_001803 [Candidatus Endobugula sp.]|jgi:hypothetical protein